mmetsp:Transcript_3256/g.10992  ORF Transcript_3256/g.10992 Transcript_3256/m.10992 type:complete len:207 (-) Transcript_3256:299-919(-)
MPRRTEAPTVPAPPAAPGHTLADRTSRQGRRGPDRRRRTERRRRPARARHAAAPEVAPVYPAEPQPQTGLDPASDATRSQRWRRRRRPTGRYRKGRTGRGRSDRLQPRGRLHPTAHLRRCAPLRRWRRPLPIAEAAAAARKSPRSFSPSRLAAGKHPGTSAGRSRRRGSARPTGRLRRPGAVGPCAGQRWPRPRRGVWTGSWCLAG